MTVVAFSLSGLPRGKGRPQTAVRGRHAIIYTDAKTRRYESSVNAVAVKKMAGRPPLTGGLSLSLQFRMPIPASATKTAKAAMAANERPHITTPDFDNLTKAICDGMNKVVFHDDAQVCRAFIVKIYSETPGVDIRVEALEPQDIEAAA